MKRVLILMILTTLLFFSACSQKEKIVYIKLPCPKLEILDDNITDDFKPVKLEIER